MSDFDAEVIVIGSGPAGVSAALPLVEAGRRVLMIDAASDTEALGGPWQRKLGAHLESLTPDDGLSPKLRTPEARRTIGAFKRQGQDKEEDFVTTGSLARGGLSRIWGAFVSEFDDDDMSGWPLTAAELKPSYRAVVERIGVSGSSDDHMADFYGRCGPLLPPPPLDPTAASILGHYAGRKPEAGFALGLARNALLTIAREQRQACELAFGCLWGCERGAIYEARQDIARLRRHTESFALRDRTTAVRLTRTAKGWEVATASGERSLRAPRLVIAAGTLGSLRLIAPLLDPLPPLRLLNSPVMAMPLLVLRRLGSEPPAQGYALAQLGFRLICSQARGDYVTGGLYAVSGLPPSSFAARLPFGRRAATDIFRALAPALTVATVYFPGHYSANQVTIRQSGAGPRIHIRGGVTDQFPQIADSVRQRLKKIWRRLGAHALPGAALATAGTDAHLGGLFPMGAPQPYGTSRFGELNAAPGLHLVDGSVLPSVPAKFTTLTIMANADRIGRHLAGAA